MFYSYQKNEYPDMAIVNRPAWEFHELQAYAREGSYTLSNGSHVMVRWTVRIVEPSGYRYFTTFERRGYAAWLEGHYWADSVIAKAESEGAKATAEWELVF
jgi:hypothetical protein